MPLRYLWGLAAGALAIATAAMTGPDRAGLFRGDETPARTHGARDGVYVVDGDTIDVAGERVRVWGIDAPDKPERLKDAARRRAVSIIGAEGITCSTGKLANMALRRIKACPSSLTSYNRVNAKCTLTRSGEDFGERMVREGFAVSYRRFDCGEYSRAMSRASNRNLGLWGTSRSQMEGLADKRSGL